MLYAKNVWGYDMKQGRLIIYENQPGDFWGLKNALENCRAESKSTGSTNPGFSLKGLSYTTIAIAAINVIVYLILEILGDTQDPFYIASHGGMYPEFIQINHQWWRIFTASLFIFGLFTTTGKQYGNILLCWIETGAGSRSF